jgi:hypothetical protein
MDIMMHAPLATGKAGGSHISAEQRDKMSWEELFLCQ